MAGGGAISGRVLLPFDQRLAALLQDFEADALAVLDLQLEPAGEPEPSI